MMGLTDFVEEFYFGIAHDKNMARLSQYYENMRPQQKDHDFFSKLGVEHEQSFDGAYSPEKQMDAEDFVFPLFSSYKQPSLD